MKRFFLLALMLPVMAMAQPAEGYVITGKIAGLKEGTVVNLVNGADGQTLGKATAANGVFTLKGRVTEPSVFQLNFTGYNEAIDLFMNNDAVNITGDAASL